MPPLQSLDPGAPLWHRHWGVLALRWDQRPRWTAAHLSEVLKAAFGVDDSGELDVPAAAEGLEVSPATVRRWLRFPRRRAHIRPDLVGRLMTPDPSAELRRRQQADYARDAAEGLVRSRGRSGSAAWSSQGWLHPHLVIVTVIAGGRLHQCRVVREQSRLHGDLVRRRQIVVARLEPNYFAATARAGELIEVVAPWRVFPSKEQVSLGRTQCWLPQAPARDFLLDPPQA